MQFLGTGLSCIGLEISGQCPFGPEHMFLIENGIVFYPFHCEMLFCALLL